MKVGRIVKKTASAFALTLFMASVSAHADETTQICGYPHKPFVSKDGSVEVGISPTENATWAFNARIFSDSSEYSGNLSLLLAARANQLKVCVTAQVTDSSAGIGEVKKVLLSRN